MMRWSVLLVVAALFGVAVIPAAAAAPVSTESDNVENLMFVDCGSFQVWDYNPYHMTSTLYFNSDGTLKMREDSFRGTDSLYISANGPLDTFQVVGGGSFAFQRKFTVLSQDPYTVQVDRVGASIDLMVPGHGQVVFTAGHLTRLNVAGEPPEVLRQVGVSKGDLDALCAALS